MAPKPPYLRHYRPGPVPNSWVYLGTDPAAAKTVKEPVPLEVQLAQQLTISNEPTNSAEKKSAQTFHSFEALAAEIRFQIWGYFLPDARVVEFEPVEKKREKLVIGCYSLYPKLASKFEQKPLGILPYACHDSRAFFLDNYRLAFDGFLRNPIYFSPKNDVVLFSNEYTLELFSDALNLIPWADARASVAPVRKAAIRWTTSQAPEGDDRSKINLALEDTPIAIEYKLKLRVLLERLTTLEKFAFLYLFRSIGEKPREEMVNFVVGLENQMSERKYVAKKEGKKNTNIPLTPWANHVPEIVMLQCPTGNFLALEEVGGSDDEWDEWVKETWELETREWECSRFETDYKSILSEDAEDEDPRPPLPFNPLWNPYHQFHQNPQFHDDDDDDDYHF